MSERVAEATQPVASEFMASIKYTTIHVTQKDIDRAMRNNSARCVVATAIARGVEHAKNVSIDVQTIRYTVDGERFVYLTPPAASGYVVAFDAGDELHPFAFRLSENHRVSVRQDKKSEAGKERTRALAIEKRAAAKLEKARQVAAIETGDEVTKQLAEATLAAAEREASVAKQQRAEVIEQLAGEPHHIPDLSQDPETGQRKRKPPARTYKSMSRHYGHRQLRINQKSDGQDEDSRRAVTAAYDEFND